MGRKLFQTIISLALILAVIRLFPWKNINWGSFNLSQKQTITVTGQARGQQKTQVARFTTSVSRVNDDKQKAVDEVNQSMAQIIDQVKGFGISEKDIKTQNISINQEEEWFYEGDRRKSRPGQWRVSNSIGISLRNVDQASELTNLLSESGATNVWGPNFYVDETTSLEADLLQEAIENAREKGEKIAQASGKKLGQIIGINEGFGTAEGFYRIAEAGGGAPVEPGTSTVSKTVTVVFELN